MTSFLRVRVKWVICVKYCMAHACGTRKNPKLIYLLGEDIDKDIAMDDKILPENNIKLEIEAPIKIHPKAMNGAKQSMVDLRPNLPAK